MKKSGVANPKMILFIWGLPGLVWSWSILLVGILFGAEWIFFFFVYVFCCSIVSFWKRNAYQVYQITTEGVENRYQKISWESVDQITLCRVCTGLHRRKGMWRFWWKIEFPSVICFGDQNSDRFEKLDPRTCVFFSLSKKNLDALRACANGNCPAVEELYQAYYDYVK